MNVFRTIVSLSASLALASIALSDEPSIGIISDPPPVSPLPTRIAGPVVLSLTAYASIGSDTPNVPPNIRVAPHTNVILNAPDNWTDPIQWTKDGKSLSGATARQLVLTDIAEYASGAYSIATVQATSGNNTGSRLFTVGIELDVQPAGRLANISTRLELPAGDSVAILGFVVSGTAAKNILIRAIGPTLASMGVKNPVSQPRFRVFNSYGDEITFGISSTTVSDFPTFFASIGAFQPKSEQEAYTCGTLSPGVFTVQVRDAAKLGGTVLVEIYDYSTGPYKELATSTSTVTSESPESR